MLEQEKITAKDEDYYVNLCHSGNRIKQKIDGYYISDFHQVEDKIVELQQRCVQNGPDDIDYELENVVLHSNLPY